MSQDQGRLISLPEALEVLWVEMRGSTQMVLETMQGSGSDMGPLAKHVFQALDPEILQGMKETDTKEGTVTPKGRARKRGGSSGVW